MQGLLQNKKLLLLVGGGVLLVFIVVLVLVFSLLRSSGPITLTYWGLWEPESVYTTVIADYKRLHPNVTVKYTKQSPINYRDRLTAALAKEGGPDIFRMHNSWLPMMKNSIAPVPANVYSAASFKSTFYPVVSSDLSLNNQPYAIPLEIDTLVMYVNQDILKTGNVSVPTTWDGADSFYTAARKLTVRDSNGRIKTAGAALGTASNVDHWQDILSLMFVQSGIDITKNGTSQPAIDALNYYTSFAKGLGTWDETQDGSTLAFASGKVAFYFGPSWRYFDLKAMNPQLNFTVAPVPQLSGSAVINFASYWTEGVAVKSKNQKAAWEFLQYLSSKDVLTKLYSAEMKIRGFGEPYSRVEMSALLAQDPNVGSVIKSAPTAKSSYLSSFTSDGDTGINSKIGKYFTDAVNSSLRGGDAKAAMNTASQGVTQVLSSYGR